MADSYIFKPAGVFALSLKESETISYSSLELLYYHSACQYFGGQGFVPYPWPSGVILTYETDWHLSGWR